jgi:hypothetical protein
MRQQASILVGSIILLGVVSAALGSMLSSQRPPAVVKVPIEPTPAPIDVATLPELLAINERAAGLAGYPAMVEVDKRRKTAKRAANEIGSLIERVEEIAGPYADRQATHLKGLQGGLEAYARDLGTARLRAAAVGNAELREELSSLLEDAGQEVKQTEDESSAFVLSDPGKRRRKRVSRDGIAARFSLGPNPQPSE